MNNCVDENSFLDVLQVDKLASQKFILTLSQPLIVTFLKRFFMDHNAQE